VIFVVQTEIQPIFVLNFVAMATKVGRGKIQLAAFDGPFPETPPQMQKFSQISLTQAEL